MKGHGDFQLKVFENIIHVYPVGDFNEIGIKELQAEVITNIPDNTSWALIEHPQNIAALTPEAANQLVKGYQTFESLNCKAIGLEITQSWQEIIHSYCHNKLTIPIYYSLNSEQLTQRVIHALESKSGEKQT